MITSKIGWREVLYGTPKFFLMKLGRRPFTVYKEVLGHWTEFKPRTVKPTDCTDCWYACRGETEAPLGIRRIIELNT
ncbi:MAG: hypothetical protein HYZ72_09250 [Deltaproteobacteria bacterium]|nr:hypothetical protein [Deltaproteobacteria bacterium]